MFDTLTDALTQRQWGDGCTDNVMIKDRQEGNAMEAED